jgi:hypothetical protein
LFRSEWPNLLNRLELGNSSLFRLDIKRLENCSEKLC